MKIKEINIPNYGPLKDFHYKCEDINLFYGHNETGKTALVDALIQNLFQDTRKKIFKNLERFKEKNIGTVVVNFKGNKYVFPSDEETLPELLDLPDMELSKLFIVRAGDLNLNKSDKWFPAVKRFLTNLNVDLNKVKQYIYDSVGLTSTGKGWSNDKTKGRKKEKVENTKERLEELKEKREQLKNISQKEEKLEKEKERLGEVNERLQKLKQARKHSEGKEASNLHQNFKEYSQKLQDFDRYKKKDLEKWKEVKRKLDSLKEKKKFYEKNLSKKEDQYKKRENETSIIGNKIDNQQKIISLIQESNLNNFVNNLFIKNFLNNKINTFFVYISLFIGFLGLLILGEISGNSLYFWSAGADILILFLFSINQRRLKKKYFKLTKKIDKLTEKTDDFKDIFQFHKMIESQLIELKTHYNTYKDSLKEISEEKRSLEQELQNFKNEIESRTSELETLRERTGKSEYEDLKKEIEQKEIYQNKKEGIREKLRMRLNEDKEEKWPDLIKHKKVSPPEGNIEYSSKEEKELRRKKEELEEDVKRIEKDIEIFYGRLEDILKIENINKIYSEISNLQSDLKRFGREKEGALLAGKIIEDFSGSFDIQLREILKTGDITVSEYFKKFTNKKYKLVDFNFDKGEFSVQGKNENWYSFTSLSTGTQDQLMLAVRIAFLMRRFKDNSPFLILDDAFLTSDYNRRKNLVKTVVGLAEVGWQVFYFTIDEHIKNLFKKDCKVKVQHLH